MMLLPLGADDTLTGAYDMWAAGRPAEAAQQLSAHAGTDWTKWYDAGLAFHEAGDRTQTVVSLVQAHRLQPAAAQPITALGELGIAVPTSMHQQLGPLAMPQWPWWPLLALAVGSALLVYGGIKSRKLLTIGIIITLSAGPAMWAQVVDADRLLRVTLIDSHVLDGSGQALQDGAIAAGSVVQLVPDQAPWQGRVLIQQSGGLRGWLPQQDLAE